MAKCWSVSTPAFLLTSECLRKVSAKELSALVLKTELQDSRSELSAILWPGAEQGAPENLGKRGFAGGGEGDV